MKRLLFLPARSSCILSFTGLVLAARPEFRHQPPAPAPRSGDAAPADASADKAANADQAADADVAKPRKITTGPTAINIIPEPSGLKTLNIHFRWPLFPDSRIEVRLVPGADEKVIGAAPEYISTSILRAKCRRTFSRAASTIRTTAAKPTSFTKDKIVFKMIGRQNSLGNQSVHVYVSGETPKKTDQPAAIYLQLHTWAVDKETLSLELSRDEFTEPVTLFVIVLPRE